MKEFVLKNRYVMVMLMVVLTILIFLTSFLPTNIALREEVVNGYNLVASSRHETVNQAIHSYIESTEAMSSRTSIRNKIVEYDNGDVTFQELYDFSYSKYYDGYKVLEVAEQAVRIVDGEVLLDIDGTELDIAEVLVDINGRTDLFYRIVEGAQYKVVVYSPIVQDDTVYGYDVIVYNLTSTLDSISSNEYSVKIQTNADVIAEGLQDTRLDTMYKTSDHYVFIGSISDTHVLRIAITKGLLFEHVTRISIINISTTVVLAIIVIAVGNILMLRHTRDLVENISMQHDHYKNQAMYDSLTKTYSRQYLDQILMDGSIKNTDTTIVMIDVDRLKWINDTHGHLEGDQVLKFVGNCLLTSFRSDDFVIRFGGDEFLVMVYNAGVSTTENIMSRINDIISQTSEFPFEVSISYGVGFVKSLHRLEAGIKEADEALYRNKEVNKGNSGK